MSNGLDVKQYLITSWPHLGVNYWAIPKAGSTSLLASLLKSRGDHDVDQLTDIEIHGADRVRYITPQQARDNGYHNFSLVRNPYQRALSLYRDFGLRRNHKRMIRDKSIDRTKLKDLDYFIDQQIVPSLDHRDNLHVRSQHWYLIGGHNKIQVDTIYHFEQISQLFNTLGLPYQHRNTTNEILELNHQQRAKIYQRYQLDFTFFGYQP